MMFIKSISGTCYKVESMPMFSAGYTVISKEEFNAWCIANGLPEWVEK